MDRQVQQKFIRGVNRRFSVQNQDDPTRLYTCQNARLQKRGETGQVSRIDGFEIIQTLSNPVTYVTFLDSLMYDDTFVILWEEDGTGKVSLVDINTGSTQSFFLLDIDTPVGKLVLLEDTIYIAPHNKQLNIIDGTWYLNDFKSETLTFTAIEGVETLPSPPPENPEPGTVGYLEFGETYWYRVRVVYHDNHKTVTSFPKKVKIVNTRYVVLNLDLPADLDGGFVRVEIFRRKGEGGFFLIDRVRTDALVNWTYEDYGKSNISALSDQNYVWADRAIAQDIVRNRLVLGNLEFKNREFTPNAQLSLVTTSLDESLIPNIPFEIYSRKRFEDGMVSPHERVGVLISSSFEQTIQINQVGAVEKENAFYLAYDRSIKTTDNLISFPTLEIYNANLPSISTHDDPQADQDRPVNPNLFVGFSQFVRSHDGSGNYTHRISDIEWSEDWSSGAQTGQYYTFDTFTGPDNTGTFEQILPTYLEIEIVSGQTLLYKRIASVPNQGLYEIAWLQGLKDYISTREMNVRLGSLLGNKRLSSSKSATDFKLDEPNVISYRDLVETQPNKFNVAPVGPTPALLNRFYLVFDPDSIFGEVDSVPFNNNDAKGLWDTGTIDLTGSGVFELLNLEYLSDGTPSPEAYEQEGETCTIWNYDDQVIQPVPEINLDNSVIYLGSTSSTGTKTYPAGIEKVDTGEFTYWRLPPHAILEGLITADDLEIFQEEYSNLLIWSEPFVIGTGINGIRNFTFTNFKAISQDYGVILDIEYINNVLLVFCERGVNQVNVGETLTQQASGEVFVSSAQFLTTDQWILRNIPNVQRKSIKIYENMLFFCDGRDVWMFADGMKNITNGAIDVGNDVSCASIDPLNKEYRIATPNGTWAYSIELGEWVGPYTYADEVSSTYRDRMFSVVGDGVVEHNVGNTFGGVPYETQIESVALDLGNVSVDKLWRKFLLQLDGEIPESQLTELMEFSYGREYDDKVVKNLFDVAKKSNLFHIGITSTEKNSTQLYWQIRTDIANFTLRSMAYDLLIRNRP